MPHAPRAEALGDAGGTGRRARPSYPHTGPREGALVTVLSLDRPRASCRVVIPYHRATPTAMKQALVQLERQLSKETEKLPSPRKQVVYITYEEISAWEPDPAA